MREGRLLCYSSLFFLFSQNSCVRPQLKRMLEYVFVGISSMVPVVQGSLLAAVKDNRKNSSGGSLDKMDGMGEIRVDHRPGSTVVI